MLWLATDFLVFFEPFVVHVVAGHGLATLDIGHNRQEPARAGKGRQALARAGKGWV